MDSYAAGLSIVANVQSRRGRELRQDRDSDQRDRWGPGARLVVKTQTTQILAFADVYIGCTDFLYFSRQE